MLKMDPAIHSKVGRDSWEKEKRKWKLNKKIHIKRSERNTCSNRVSFESLQGIKSGRDPPFGEKGAPKASNECDGDFPSVFICAERNRVGEKKRRKRTKKAPNVKDSIQDIFSTREKRVRIDYMDRKGRDRKEIRREIVQAIKLKKSTERKKGKDGEKMNEWIREPLQRDEMNIVPK